jgi:DNA-directed RNA polymerase specialized sigma24 family protein
MKIYEILQSTVGAIGSTTGEVTPINSTTNKTITKLSNLDQTNAQNKQLDNLLKKNQINVKSTDDFFRATTALQQNQPIDKLPPEQRKAIDDYTIATLSKPELANQMNVLLKTMNASNKIS